jgi:hypothetical protein
MGTPIHAATHPLLGTHRRMVVALAIVVAALAAAVITTVLLLQSGTTVPSVVDGGGSGNSDTAPEWLQNYRFGSADGLGRAAG